ncbi:MAG: hypothetical protein Q7S53_01330 [bacterium]|nr:hypothetical protein [bacterium]
MNEGVNQTGDLPEIKYEDIEGELSRSLNHMFLEKYWTKGKTSKEAIEELNLPHGLESSAGTNFPPVAGRSGLHLMRILGPGRSESEREFGLSVLRNSGKINYEEGEIENNRLKHSGEGADTAMFWTFSPYLYKALGQKGLSDEEALKKTFLWGHNENEEGKYIHLRGLEKYKNAWILMQPGDVTHQFTEQEANRIVDEVILAEQPEK